MSNNITFNSKAPQFQRKRKLSLFSESTESTDDQNNCQKNISSQNNKKYHDKNQIKYKTQLCKNFSQTGVCPYKKKCKFAHGHSQLNQDKRQQGKYYRTKKCLSFWNQGTCAYGKRCQFQHIKFQKETKQLLATWKFALQMQNNQAGFVGSKLLRLLRYQ